jgi:hypothetical protein
MYTLCINDKNNQTQTWWFNFLFSLDNTDVAVGLKKWGGRVVYDRHGYSDTIIFDREEDIAWFLLKWT